MLRSSVIFSTILLMLVSACATVVRGKSDKVEFTSSPAGATVETSMGTSCVTPCAMEVLRKQEFRAVFTLNGVRKSVDVVTKVAGEGGAALAGNILVGGIIGAAVDTGSGASLDHFPNPVHVDF